MNPTAVQLGRDVRDAFVEIGHVMLFGDPRCDAGGPLWRSSALLQIAGMVAGVVAGGLGHGVRLGHIPAWLVTGVAGMIAGMVAAGMFDRWIRPAWHGHCNRCGLCSIRDGISATRSRDQSVAALTAGGWAASVGGSGLLVRDLHLCREHNRPEIIDEYRQS